MPTVQIKIKTLERGITKPMFPMEFFNPNNHRGLKVDAKAMAKDEIMSERLKPATTDEGEYY
jgi:hypothetical protein